MSKKNYLLFILTITAILYSSVTNAQEVKERAMVVYSKKTKEHSKAKTFAAFTDFGTSLFMRQDPAYPDLSECNASLDLDISYGYFINSYFYIGIKRMLETDIYIWQRRIQFIYFREQ